MGVRNGVFILNEARRKNKMQEFYKITKRMKADFQ
jgi:hypothetical protein